MHHDAAAQLAAQLILEVVQFFTGIVELSIQRCANAAKPFAVVARLQSVQVSLQAFESFTLRQNSRHPIEIFIKGCRQGIFPNTRLEIFGDFLAN